MDRSAGKVTFCGIMLVLVLGIGIHLGYLYGSMYYGYLKMEEAMKEASLSVVTEKDETIRKAIVEKAKDAGVPLKEENIRIVSDGRTKRVEASWSVTLNLLGVFPRKHDFRISSRQGK
ncbi:MAG: hypothetical protein HYR98_02110 [Nitrospirae bacterium]|nr:hypothetical protein [Nitrospirota bacterium]